MSLFFNLLNSDSHGFRFVDRDMVMRFRGGGVGHTSTQAASNIFRQDRDHLDSVPKQLPRSDYEDEVEEKEADRHLEENGDDSHSDGQDVVESDISDSELLDYGYDFQESDEDNLLEAEEQDNDDSNEEIDEEDLEEDELSALGYATF